MVYISVDEDGDLHQISPKEWSQLPEKRIFNSIEEELHYIKLRLLQKSQENLKLWEYVQKVSKSKSNSTENFIERTLKINEILQAKLDQIFSGRLSDLFDLLVMIELLSLGYWLFKKFKLWMYPPPKEIDWKAECEKYKKQYKETLEKLSQIQKQLKNKEKVNTNRVVETDAPDIQPTDHQ